jgi:hypothetical protein
LSFNLKFNIYIDFIIENYSSLTQSPSSSFFFHLNLLFSIQALIIMQH